MFLKDNTEVLLPDCERPQILNPIQFKKSPIGVINTQIQSGDILAPLLKSISEMLKCFAQHGIRVMCKATFVPSGLHNFKEPRV